MSTIGGGAPVTVGALPALQPLDVTVAPFVTVSRRLDYIDILRGLACLWVLYHHVLAHWIGQGDLKGHALASGLTAFARIGYLGIHLFIVLSGFCLFYPLVLRQEVSAIHLDAWTFFTRRFKRIAPPYYAAMLFFILVRTQSWGASSIGPNRWDFNMLAHLLMIHNLFPATIALLNPSLWSLALEVQLYLAFPLLVFAARRWGMPSVLAGTLLLSLVYQWFCLTRYGANVSWEVGASRFYALPALWVTFAAGMAAAALVARPHHNQYRIALGVFLVLLPISVFIALRLPQFGMFREPVHALTGASLVVLLASGRLGFVNNTAWLRPFTMLGIISYSVYLLHQPLLVILQPLVASFGFRPTLLFALFTATALPLLLLISYGFYCCFERPFLRKKGVRIQPPKKRAVSC